MKSTPPETAWLADIVAACERIERYLQGVDRTAFMANDEKQFAVYAQLIIIGEAANRFPPEFQHANANLPWRQMIGMRNRIVLITTLLTGTSSGKLPRFMCPN